MEGSGFIKRFGVWTEDQTLASEDIRARVEAEDLRLVRLVWADTHGAARAKAVTVPVFLAALEAGYNINVATATLDGAGGRVFASFSPGGGMDLPEMTGSPNLTIVPDPETFRVLPWAPDVGWVLCDEFFNDGRRFHFSTRALLRRQVARLAERGLDLVVGLEAEWYLARVVQEQLTDDNIGWPGSRGRPIATAPIEPGFHYHSESNLDLMQPMLSELAHVYEALGLRLRSLENEWGPGQVECTFEAQDALAAADDYLLFRTATRQVCRRAGCFATFMCRPALAGHYPNGWHLHQSLRDAKRGDNVFMPGPDGAPLSALGLQVLAGLIEHAGAATALAVPTVNGYRRFRRNSLAPDRVTWAYDHRGAMLRVLGGAGDAGTRIENRAGEPAANPYLYIAAQIVAGLDGVDRDLTPPPADDDPYKAERPLLPANLGAALTALGDSALMRAQLGDLFVDYFIKLKTAELERYTKYHEEHDLVDAPDVVSAWEQNEYYDFF